MDTITEIDNLTFINMFNKGTKDFKNKSLTKIDMSHLELVGLDFTGSIFKNVNMAFTKSKMCIFNNVKFQDVTLYKSYFSCSSFYQSKLPKSVFKKSKLITCNFFEADLAETDFSGSELNYSTFIATDLTNANLNYTSLIETEFTYSILKGTTFERSITHNHIFF